MTDHVIGRPESVDTAIGSAFRLGDSDGLVLTSEGYLKSSAKNASALLIQGGAHTVRIAGHVEAVNGDGLQSSATIALTVDAGGLITGLFGSSYIGNDRVRTITNHGTIASTGANPAMAFGGDSSNHIVNHGIIDAPNFNIALKFLDHSDSVVENYNVIDGDIYVTGGDTVARIVNRGEIKGRILLDKGNDIYDGAGGTITGITDLGQGSNIGHGGGGSESFFYLSTAAAPGVNDIDGGAGIDQLTIRQSGLVTVDLSRWDQQITGDGGPKLTIRHIEQLALGWADPTARAKFIGNDQANTLSGAMKDDTLDGAAGADVMSGGEGDDTYYVDNADDRIIEYTDQGYDVVYTNLKTTTGFENVEKVFYTGPADPGAPPPTRPSPTPDGTPPVSRSPVKGYVVVSVTDPAGGTAHAGSSDTILIGTKGKDQLYGGSGNDRLYGKASNDFLVGGDGKDTFVFDTRCSTKKKNIDAIKGFNVADDTIELSKATFSKLGAKGFLKKGEFYVGDAPHDRSVHVIYDKKKGVLWYDRDGTGGADAVQIGKIDKKLALSHADFLII
jgi:Ca2+-binding RTX toxin-like protein